MVLVKGSLVAAVAHALGPVLEYVRAHSCCLPGCAFVSAVLYCTLLCCAVLCCAVD
jgi:hypothetical protein